MRGWGYMSHKCPKCKREASAEEETFCDDCFVEHAFQLFRAAVFRARKASGKGVPFTLCLPAAVSRKGLVARKLAEVFAQRESLPHLAISISEERVAHGTKIDVSTIDDLGKRCLLLMCQGRADEIPSATTMGPLQMSPFADCTDKDIYRLYNVLFTSDAVLSGSATGGVDEPRSEDPLAALVSNFVDRMTADKASTPQVLLRTIQKIPFPPCG